MVKKLISKLLLKLTPKKVQEIYTFSHSYKQDSLLEDAQISYSQEGEDLVLNKLLRNRPTGFYIDVGANHPKRFSNTYLFYKKGWRGINIEPNPDMFNLLSEYRGQDLNLNIGISDKNEILEYFMFNETALNTFSIKEKNEYLENDNYYLLNTLNVSVNTLDDVLGQHKQFVLNNIDFLSVDAEGFDLKVLQSINLKKYKPEIILVEILNINKIIDVFDNDVFIYLKQFDYELILRTGNTFFFKINSL